MDKLNIGHWNYAVLRYSAWLPETRGLQDNLRRLLQLRNFVPLVLYGPSLLRT